MSVPPAGRFRLVTDPCVDGVSWNGAAVAVHVDGAAEAVYARIVDGLRSDRLDAGLSQPALASLLSVRIQTVSGWETGGAMPNLEHLMLWALDLGRRLVIVDENGGLPYGPLQRGTAESWVAFEQRRLVVPLQDRREALGLTPAEVGQLVGVSPYTIGRWERVQAPPRPKVLTVWAQKLGCSVALWSLDSLPGPAPRKAPRASAGRRRGARARKVWSLRINPTVEQQLRHIQSQLGEARLGTDLSLEAVGGLLGGLAARTVRDWERCYDNPGMSNLIEWAGMFGFRLAVIEPGAPRPALPAVSLEAGESLVEHEIRRLTKRLRKRRRERKLSQADLARIVGVDRTSLQGWETGARFPMALSLMVCADRLGCTVDLVPDEGVSGYGRVSGLAMTAVRP